MYEWCIIVNKNNHAYEQQVHVIVIVSVSASI
jgi:hypothetical protein